jgi:hypothetical protein
VHLPVPANTHAAWTATIITPPGTVASAPRRPRIELPTPHKRTCRMTLHDILYMIGAVVTAVLLVVVARWRRRTFAVEMRDAATREVCPHLRPALNRLLESGHVVRRVGQRGPDMPMEIHLQPAFDPRALQTELKLDDPVHVSQRNVLYCPQCWCELRPED